eukprot:216098_1
MKAKATTPHLLQSESFMSLSDNDNDNDNNKNENSDNKMDINDNDNKNSDNKIDIDIRQAQPPLIKIKYKSKKSKKKKFNEGYLNLANEQGISRVRDTSTYYKSGWNGYGKRYGYKRRYWGGW